MKTLIAYIPATTIQGHTYPARIETYYLKDGKWYYDLFNNGELVEWDTESIIITTSQASNWEDIKSEFFPEISL